MLKQEQKIMQSAIEKLNLSIAIKQHIQLLAHNGYGVTELRIFKPKPLVAYADNIEDVIRLVKQVQSYAPGIYTGVQPRPLWLLDKAPNRWKRAHSKPTSNCANDESIEYIVTVFFDIDVDSPSRRNGFSASEEELQFSLNAARLIASQEGLALSSTICCSGNGHYVIAPIVPIQVDSDDVAVKFKKFCQEVAEETAKQVSGVKIDSVYNLSRVMRLMGTVNRKGHAAPDRPHRRAYIVTEPIPAKSMALHHMILNTEITVPVKEPNTPNGKIKCDLSKIEQCEFIKWCRKYPTKVSEPLWFAMITNLSRLEGGEEFIHEISRLDEHRYDYQQTQRLIERILCAGYNAVNCENIKGLGFRCHKLGSCHVKAPMYLTHLFSI